MIRTFFLFVLLAGLMACHSNSDHHSQAVSEVKQLSSAALDKLHAADAADGNADQTVSKCASCSLLMDGKSEFAVNVADTQMLFCSKNCQTLYAQDPGAKLEALKLPEAKNDMP